MEELTVREKVLDIVKESKIPLTSTQILEMLPKEKRSTISSILSYWYNKGKLKKVGKIGKAFKYTINISGDRKEKAAERASAEDIVAAIFLQIEANFDEIKRLKERNALLEEESIQLREMLKDAHKKPVKLPGYISNALAINGEK